MTGTDEDCLPSTTTDWDLFWRNALIQETVLRFIPKLNSYKLIKYGLLYLMLYLSPFL